MLITEEFWKKQLI